MKILPEHIFDDESCYITYTDNGQEQYFDLNELEKPFYYYKTHEITDIISKKYNTFVINPNYKLGILYVINKIKENISNFHLELLGSMDNLLRSEAIRICVTFIPDKLNNNKPRENNIQFEIKKIVKYSEDYFPNTCQKIKKMIYYHDVIGSVSFGTDIQYFDDIDYEKQLLIEFIKADNEIYDKLKYYITNKLYPDFDDVIRKEIPYYFNAKDLNLL